MFGDFRSPTHQVMHRFTVLFLVFWSLIFVSITQGRSAEQIEVEVSLLDAERLVFPVNFENGLVANFTFDTGASTSVISASLATRLKALPDPAFAGRKLTVNGQPVWRTTLNQVKAGGLRLDGSFEVLKDNMFIESKPGSLVGALSMDNLRAFAVAVLRTEHKLIVYSPGRLDNFRVALAGFGPTAKQVPLIWDEDRSGWRCQVTLTQGTTTCTEQMLVDTGSNISIISAATAKTLSLSPNQTRVYHGYSTTGNFLSSKIDRLTLGNLAIDNIDSIVYTTSAKGISPTLGTDILKRYNLLFDFPASILYLLPIK